MASVRGCVFEFVSTQPASTPATEDAILLVGMVIVPPIVAGAENSWMQCEPVDAGSRAEPESHDNESTDASHTSTFSPAKFSAAAKNLQGSL